MCGIAAFLPDPNNKRALNKALFNYIFLRQDSRGGDSMGLVYSVDHPDHKYCVRWGDPNKQIKKASDFYKNNKESLNDMKECPIIIGHSRKKSSGSFLNIDGAHPFVFDKVIGVHNGTLKNENELARYLEVDIKELDIDSQKLFKCINDAGTKTLKYYKGAAALVWIDLETDNVNIWTGKSDSYSAYTNYNSYRNYGNYATYPSTSNNDPERPLHILKTVYGYFLSSEKGPLESLLLMMSLDEQVEGEVINKFKPNHLYTYKPDGVLTCQEFKRENIPVKTYTKSLVPKSTTHVEPKIDSKIEEDIDIYEYGGFYVEGMSGKLVSKKLNDVYTVFAGVLFKTNSICSMLKTFFPNGTDIDIIDTFFEEPVTEIWVDAIKDLIKEDNSIKNANGLHKKLKDDTVLFNLAVKLIKSYSVDVGSRFLNKSISFDFNETDHVYRLTNTKRKFYKGYVSNPIKIK